MPPGTDPRAARGDDRVRDRAGGEQQNASIKIAFGSIMWGGA
jgi:hypothetical protein